MSDGDGMTSSTQVPTVRCVWVPGAMSCQALNVIVSQGSSSVGPYPILNAPRCGS
jgi:hypothetical protein